VCFQAIGTKFSSRWGDQMVDLAINAVRKVTPSALLVVVMPMHAAAGCLAVFTVSVATGCGIAHLIAVFAAHVGLVEMWYSGKVVL
jgi:hypothetical protein